MSISQSAYDREEQILWDQYSRGEIDKRQYSRLARELDEEFFGDADEA